MDTMQLFKVTENCEQCSCRRNAELLNFREKYRTAGALKAQWPPNLRKVFSGLK